MAERKYGEAAPETVSTISDADWYGKDISGENHANVLFTNLDLTDAQNAGAVFNGCTFRRTRFNSSSHKDSAFVNCTFVACKFYDASFRDCKFLGSMFDRCSYDLLKVHGGDWSFAGLPGADLRTASFEGARLREADLTGARCEGSTLRDLDLSGAWLHGANFTRCDLRGSDLSALEPENVTLTGAIITIDQTLAIARNLGLDVRPH